MVLKKTFFLNSYVELETPPLHAKKHLKFSILIIGTLPLVVKNRFLNLNDATRLISISIQYLTLIFHSFDILPCYTSVIHLR